MKSIFTILILLIGTCAFADDSTDKLKSGLSEAKKIQEISSVKPKSARVSPVTQVNRTSADIIRKRPVSDKAVTDK